MEKFSLIDSNAEIANEAEGESHRERLNKRTSRTDDAIVRSASNYTKMQKVAEMTTFNKLLTNLLITIGILPNLRTFGFLKPNLEPLYRNIDANKI